MKTGKTLQELKQELVRQQRAKRDFILDTRQMNVVASEGELALTMPHGTFGIRDTMHEQLATKLSIPRQYYDRMKSEAPALLTQNINQWLHTQPERRMVRTIDGQARAFLSDRYRILDNLDLAVHTVPVLMQTGFEVASAEITDRHMYLKFASPRLHGEVKVNDIVQYGLSISGSEIGEGAINVEDFLTRLVCTNGMIVSRPVSQRHVGRRHDGFDATEYFTDETRQMDDAAFFMKVKDTIAGMTTQKHFDELLDKMRGSTLVLVKNPVAAIEVTQKKFNLTDAETTMMAQHLGEGQDFSLWGLANAITRMSSDVSDYDRATELERLGGKIITLAPSEYKVITEAKVAA